MANKIKNRINGFLIEFVCKKKNVLADRPTSKWKYKKNINSKIFLTMCKRNYNGLASF